MEVKVTLRNITVRDDKSGEEFTVRTVRTAKDIAGYIEESEKEEIISKLEDVVYEAYNK